LAQVLLELAEAFPAACDRLQRLMLRDDPPARMAQFVLR
jgi:hypothetical protein